MEEIVLSFMVEKALARMLTLVADEVKLLWGFDEQVRSLSESLDAVREMLKDAEEKQVTHKSVNRWLRQLKDAAFEAEDLFDELAYENLRRQVEMQDQATEVGNFSLFSTCNLHVKKAAFRTKMAHKVGKVKGFIDKIMNATGFDLNAIPKERVRPQLDLDRLTDSVLDNPVVGRGSDVSKIVNLLSSCDQLQFTIVPIVGMGGLGKTALAKLVCEELMKENHFDLKIWVSVYDKFDDQRILKEMLQTVNPNVGAIDNRDAILRELRKELQVKRFLIVIDDVWNNVSNRWDVLKNRLSTVSQEKGNAIIITTRSEEVASRVETSPEYRYRLNGLSDDECWSIIEAKVLCRNGRTLVPLESDMEAIGKEIAVKCRGVPLAAKVLGGTMSLKRDKRAWLSVRNSNVLSASDEMDNVRSILKLSFDHLPTHLKPCFAFCSIFHKDCFINKDRLIQLWRAEGLLGSSSKENGDNCFNALLHNSFFQDVERDEYENIIGCKMHDLVYDLALSISKSETLTSENCSAQVDMSCVRSLYVDSQCTANLEAIPKVSVKLRNLIVRDLVFQESWKFKSLRTLDLDNSNIEELPSSIGKLKHLRYLDISFTNIKVLPESITKLYNLQTLRFLICESLEELPRNKIRNLISLRHIMFSYDHQMPSGLGKLTSLETLPLFVVGSDRGGSIQELERLNELGGELEIKNLEKVRDKTEAEKANLKLKTRLKALRFEWSDLIECREEDEEDNLDRDEEVLERLQPPSSIESIEINNYMGKQFPSWLLMMNADSCATCNDLVKLKLEDCRRSEEIPRLGHLPRLKILEIDGMDSVRCLGNEFYGADVGSSSNGETWFPALKNLTLSFMKELVEWTIPAVGKAFPCLEELSIVGCRKLTRIPIVDRSSLVKLDIDGCDALSYLFDELNSFPSLQSLKIGGCSNLTSLPSTLMSLTSLKELSIGKCPGLTCIPGDLGKLTSLVSLEITCCINLSYFPDEMLCVMTRLKKLSIGGFSEQLNHFNYLNSIEHLPSLADLDIYGQHQLNSLPEQLQRLTAIKDLGIIEFDGIEALPEWLGNLSSLEYLSIKKCKNVKYLPAATTMGRLSELRYLGISRCPLLKENCAKGSGSEWLKISDIPYLYIP